MTPKTTLMRHMSFVSKTLMTEQTNTKKVKSSSISRAHPRHSTVPYCAVLCCARLCALFQPTLLYFAIRCKFTPCYLYINAFPLYVPSFLSYCLFNILFSNRNRAIATTKKHTHTNKKNPKNIYDSREKTENESSKYGI